MIAPLDPHGEPNWILQEIVEIEQLESADIVGHPDISDPLAVQFRDMAKPSDSSRRVVLVALEGDAPDGAVTGDVGFLTVAADDHSWPRTRVLGLNNISAPLHDNTDLVDCGGISARERGGVADALLVTATEDVARRLNRHTILTYTWHRADDPTAPVASLCGEGSVPRDGSAEVLLDAGYELLQIERNQVLDVPVTEDKLAECEQRSAASAGTYAIEQLMPPFAEEDRPRLMAAMSQIDSEAPLEDVEREAAQWDDARFDHWLARRWSEHMTTILAVARHLPTGDIAGYSQLLVPLTGTKILFQGGTLVLPEHRGHGLGWAVKAAALRQLQAEFGERTQISTWNAQNNPWMLAINEHLGYRLASVSGLWRKQL